MPTELPLGEVGVAHYSTAGGPFLTDTWCTPRPICTVCGPGAVSLIQDPFLWCETQVPICRLKHCCSPFETVGWVFPNACVLHTLDPLITAQHTINTKEFLPLTISEKAEGIHARYKNISAFFSSAANLFRFAAKETEPCIDEARIERYAARLAARERGPKGGGVFRCFFSYLSSREYYTDYAAITAICSRIYVVEDTVLPIGHRLMSALERCFISSGQTLIVGICPITGEAEHLLLPDNGVAFLLSNHWHTVDFPVYQRIYTSRFCCKPSPVRKFDLLFRGTDELLKESARSLCEVEQLYIKNEDEACRYLEKKQMCKVIGDFIKAN